MKLVQINEYGSAEVLKMVERSIPTPETGELLVKIEAIGVNYADILRRKNTYFMPTPLPYSLGVEAVGEIVEVGEDTSDTPFIPGTRILAILPYGGGYAEYVTANVQYCVPLPTNIQAQTATGIFVQGSTAHLLIHEVADNLSGKTVLIHAASGGVGSLLVQLAKMEGAKVIAASSSTAKLRIATELGADVAIDYSRSQWTEKLIHENGGEKVDYIFEMVGGEIYTQSFQCLEQGGTMIVYGAASGKKGMIHSEHFVDEGLQLKSFNLAHFMQSRPETWEKSLRAITGLISEGKIKVHTAHSYSLKDVAKAHQDIEARKTSGKVVLIP